MDYKVCAQMHTSLSTPKQAAWTNWGSSTKFPLGVILLICGALTIWINVSLIFAGPPNARNRIVIAVERESRKGLVEFPFKCSNLGLNEICKANDSMIGRTFQFEKRLSSAACPEYFRWIREDLLPWKRIGISRDMLERAKDYAHFRLVIKEGKVYVEKFLNSYQTRDVFTIWGILQLLRLYPGKVPDLELMFWAEDQPLVKKNDYQGANVVLSPPVFLYSRDDDSLGISFPDWTFWGWAETNIRPWRDMLDDIVEGSKRTKWMDRVPYAYWKGNPYTAIPRMKFVNECNVSEKYDWNARFYQQKWEKAKEEGYKHSNLEDQCTHRYKIYVEGNGWSVSQKYILACDSMTLVVKPKYYDFFSRSMVPLQHYWPTRSTNYGCGSIKFAVEWGNNHTDQAQAIGKAGSKYVKESLKMKYVYDYMLHLLNEYAKLMKFHPKVPEGAVKLCSELIACSQSDLGRKFMEESLVKSPNPNAIPCTMPPHDPNFFQAFYEKKERVTRQVEMLEDDYYNGEYFFNFE